MKLKPKILKVCLIVLFFSNTIAAQKEIKVLFVGNSFTYYYNLPQVVSSMAKTQGITTGQLESQPTEEQPLADNSTETTTSERNELQTEVSSVINQDQSQNTGASAGVGSWRCNGNDGRHEFRATGNGNECWAIARAL